jgi:tetratricopeptide (TPR) repeat protein
MVKSFQQRFLMSKSHLPAVVASVALALGGFSAASYAADAAPTGPQPSKDARKPLKAAQDAQAAKKHSEVIAKSQEVLALPGKNAYDSYLAYRMMAAAYSATGNQAEAARAIEAALDSGAAPPADQATLTKALAVSAYQAKNYPKAIDYGNRMVRSGSADADIYNVVGGAYYQQKMYKEAAKFMADYISDQERRGQTPKENTLLVMSSSYENLADATGATNALEKLVVYYPKPAYWNGLLYQLLRTQGLTDRHTLNIYRLMQATQTLKEASDYTEMAELAVSAGNPGEAQKVLEQGFTAGIFVEQRVKDRNQRLLDAAKKAATTDLASLPKLEKEAAAAKTGGVDIALGGGYLSHGQNDKAIEAIARGLGKGGLKSPVEGQLMLGIAQLRAGNKAEALKTFKSVKTDDPVYERIAKLWTLYVS